jgi:hypothetical protein
MNNPGKLATLGTQNTGRRQTKQKHNTEYLNDEQHGPHQPSVVNRVPAKGKQFLPIIIHTPCYSSSIYESNTTVFSKHKSFVVLRRFGIYRS